METCTVEGCTRPLAIKSRKICGTHNARLRRNGTLEPKRTGFYSQDSRSLSDDERFWQRVERKHESECWPWLGGVTGSGYGMFTHLPRKNGRMTQTTAHRYAWLSSGGDIPDGWHIDHLCRNTVCVNPAHLEPVTPQVNTLRGVGPSAKNAERTECVNGHELDPDNVWLDGKRNSRHCRTCSRRRWHEWNERKKSAHRAESELAR